MVLFVQNYPNTELESKYTYAQLRIMWLIFAGKKVHHYYYLCILQNNSSHVYLCRLKNSRELQKVKNIIIRTFETFWHLDYKSTIKRSFAQASFRALQVKKYEGKKIFCMTQFQFLRFFKNHEKSLFCYFEFSRQKSASFFKLNRQVLFILSNEKIRFFNKNFEISA